MKLFYVRRCSKNDMHYVVTTDRSFKLLVGNKCPYCHSDFDQNVIEIPNDNTTRIGFNAKDAIDALKNHGLYFAKIEIQFSETSMSKT